MAACVCGNRTGSCVMPGYALLGVETSGNALESWKLSGIM